MKEPLRRVRVWDLPTRVFHWVLAACVIASVVTAKIGGNAMVWHFRLGYVVFTLLLFRVLWGLIGGYWSRFTSFLYSPSTVLRYLRGSLRSHHHDVGHSPLGALSVLSLLGVLSLQVGSGLVADDEIANTGPLNRFVSGTVSSAATAWHKAWGQWLIIGLALLHVAAIVFYLAARKRNLVHPMLVGDKLVPPDVPGSADHARTRLIALAAVGLCAAAVAWVVSQAG